jgi:hypothetical protein
LLEVLTVQAGQQHVLAAVAEAESTNKQKLQRLQLAGVPHSPSTLPSKSGRGQRQQQQADVN